MLFDRTLPALSESSKGAEYTLAGSVLIHS